MDTNDTIPGFRQVPRTGVIYVMHESAQHGFRYGHPEWANLGQGSPESGPMAGAPDRVERFDIAAGSHAYGPVEGDRLLRQKVADLYNELFRKDKDSKYTWENVSIAGGGRLALTRVVAALDNINLGHFIPDYTAYEELLSGFKTFIPIPILLDAGAGYKISQATLRHEIMGHGFNALLMSNPANPTGQLAEGNELKAWVRTARDLRCSLILDEFYSYYIYTGFPNDCKIVSAAAYVDDVNKDPIIIVDGLTKNWRYPGWRLSWTLGPKSVIESIASAGSFLDGGANHPFQHQAIPLLDPEVTLQETRAIQEVFRAKRDFVLERVTSMGIEVESDPEGAFYVWANLSKLPAPLNDGLEFFRAGLDHKVITVPGVFFDVNPGRRRPKARYQHYTRISFGPEMASLERGMDALEKMIKGG